MPARWNRRSVVRRSVRITGPIRREAHPDDAGEG
jgi:hypothetical protein